MTTPARAAAGLLGRLAARAARRCAARRDVPDLPGRRGLLERCAAPLRAVAEDAETAWTVSVVGFDDLRELRLALGGPAADAVLAESARRLAELPGAVVARLGPDTLAVVRPLTTGTAGDAPATGRQEGTALRSTLLEPVELPDLGPGRGLRVRPETSVGVACVPDHGRDLEDLLAAADVAHARAGTAPRRVAVAEGTAAVDLDALALHTELPAAIADGQLRVHYQPLVTAGTHRVVGVEALVRWQHPERGLLGPGAFVPLAERSQAIVALTRWVLREAVAQCAAWRADGHDVGVSVNLSAAVVGEPTLVGTVRDVLAAHRLDPGVLTLEVTESALLADPAGAAAVLAALRAAGARVSLDDFGTGYTSLTMLRQLEVDELKIDRTFVAAAPQAPADAAIVRALVDLAHRLSVEVVAEGVEDARTAEVVRGLGADVLQGFHFSRPVPAADVFAAAPAPVREVVLPADEPVRAPRPVDEADRLRLAHRVLESASGSQRLLRRVTALAAAVTGARFASFNVVTDEHVHALATHGHDVTRGPRDGTPCAWAVLQQDLLELDCRTDPRVAGGVAGRAGVRHYAGVPVVDAHGRTLGVLCVYDLLPIPLDDGRRAQLRALAGLVAEHLEGAEAAGLLDRVHALLQAVADVELAADACAVGGGFARAVHDLTRPDFSFVLRRISPLAERWDVVGVVGDADADALDGHVVDTSTRSAVSRAVAGRRPVWVPDAGTSSVVDAAAARHLGARSVLTVPVADERGVRLVLVQCWRDAQDDLPPVLRDAAVAAAARAAHALGRLETGVVAP
ncbi:EAL domain-containing protein [Kineococcus aurantiacus]|uniref:EAL domain-containing protein (Putative c-di-GMP-specific phosphodiesterase class I)/GGDEF domain-containing protein n=1 Tax=Kineococcus aurantiacus TaxID=37633 RepID=A0A7Y9DKS1_9ACTN|nr:EAL domain-containing protein (putative c-di-GMP-specific phosphodiesterase class I)/GGDEF domain-containing protein [Kineococcus aurantiacus]